MAPAGTVISSSILRETLLALSLCDPTNGVRFRLANCAVEERLVLDDLRVPYPVTFSAVDFRQGISIARAHFHHLVFDEGCAVTATDPEQAAVMADGACIDHDFSLDVKAKGEVRLVGASIGGQLNMANATLRNGNGTALSADHATITGDALFNRSFTAEGEVRLLGASIGGQLNLEDAALRNTNDDALSADGATIAGGAFLNGSFTAEGEVRLLGASIGRQLNMVGATLRNKGGNALSADGATITGSALLSGPFNAEGGVRLIDVTITGPLGLTDATLRNVNGDALFADRAKLSGGAFLNGDFTAEGEVRFLGASIGGQLNLKDGTLRNENSIALSADAAKITGGAFLNGTFNAEGEVRLAGAAIGGSLSLEGAALRNRSGNALCADGVRITGSAHLSESFNAEGEVRFVGALIDGQFNLANATLQNPSGRALSADGARILADAHFNDSLKTEGEVRLVGASIGGQLNLSNALLRNPDGMALAMDGAVVTGNAIFSESSTAEGHVMLVGVTITGDLYWSGNVSMLVADGLRIVGALRDDYTFRPISSNGLSIGGFGPRTLASNDDGWELTSRLKWLEKIFEGHVPAHLFEHVADLFEARGLSDAAARIRLRREELITADSDATPSKTRRAWRGLVGATTGYGYRFTRAIVWLLATALVTTLATVSLAGWTQQGGGLLSQADGDPGLFFGEPSMGRVVAWSIDSLIPVINLGYDDTVQIADGYWWMQSLHTLTIAAGWILGVVFAAGYTSRVIAQPKSRI